MKTRIAALAVAVLVIAALAGGLVGSAAAAEEDSWWEDMWQWCHGGGGPGARGGAFLDWGTANAVSKALGMTTNELRTELDSGKSVFAVAEAKGVSKEKLVDAVLAPYRDTLAIQVKYEYLTQDEADQLLKQRTDWLNQAFAQTPTAGTSSGTRGFRGPGGFGGMMGRFGGMMGGFGGMMGGLWYR